MVLVLYTPIDGWIGGEGTHKLSHAALLHGGLVPAVDLCEVVALDLGDVLVHCEESG